MRKIVVLSFLTLDGVMQGPGGPEEDASGGFKHGGWVAGYWSTELEDVMARQMRGPFDLLLGRKTYDLFAAYWPNAGDAMGAKELNAATKYVASRQSPKLGWEKSVLVSGDVVSEIRGLKNQEGPEIQVHGSGNLVQTLLENDLVDELWLKFFPITLGSGKRLFAEGTVPAGFKLLQCEKFGTGVIAASFARSGPVKTGSFA